MPGAREKQLGRSAKSSRKQVGVSATVERLGWPREKITRTRQNSSFIEEARCSGYPSRQRPRHPIGDPRLTSAFRLWLAWVLTINRTRQKSGSRVPFIGKRRLAIIGHFQIYKTRIFFKTQPNLNFKTLRVLETSQDLVLKVSSSPELR